MHICPEGRLVAITTLRGNLQAVLKLVAKANWHFKHSNPFITTLVFKT